MAGKLARSSRIIGAARRRHGSRLRMRTRAGRAVLAARRHKRPRPAECPISASLSPGCVAARSSRRTVRTGIRAGRSRVVGHLLVRDDALHQGEPARVGFVVSRAVGSAVTRNRVKRDGFASSCAGIFSRFLAVAYLWCAQMPQPRTRARQIWPQIWIW